MSVPEPYLCQIALSVANVSASLRFYTSVFGYQQATGGRFLSGERLGRIQGLDDPACICWWLINDQPFFQLELFQYATPAPLPRPATWTPDDIGYTSMTFTVPNFDAAFAAAKAIAPVVRDATVVDGARQATVADPDKTHVTIVEAPGTSGARPIRVGASTPSSARSRALVADALGCPIVAEGSGSFSGSSRGTTLDFVERPGRMRPEGWRVNAHGILNVAMGYRDWAEYAAAANRAAAAGIHVETPPADDQGLLDVSYILDSDGFSVELLWCPERSDVAIGFPAPK